MSFIYYKRSKKEKLQFQRFFLKVDAHEVIFSHPAKIWHTLPKFGTPCEFDDFALRNALFLSILLLITLPNPFQVWQGVLKCSKARILHVIDLQLALPQLAQNSPSILAYFSGKKATKNTKTYQKLVSNIRQVLNMPIGMKKSNYYSKVLSTIKFKLIKMHFLSSNHVLFNIYTNYFYMLN